MEVQKQVTNGDEFMKGAIKSIKLENFLIYDQVVVTPGPHLNVIIGPNATGKSTIVNAICLGLAGKTTILGRAKDVASYIKNGNNQSKIEIELYNPGQRNYNIKRVITRTGPGTSSNTWAINGKNTTVKQVEELVASLNIQVSNLCQFLPQDRVADFVKMTNTELLVNTMKAADRHLYDMHVRLKDAQKDANQLNMNYTKIRENLERETKLNAALEREVENVKERKSHEERLKTLQLKRPWAEYEIHRKKYDQLREEKKALKERVKEATAANAPAKKALDDAKEADNKMSAKFRESGSEIIGLGRSFNTVNEKLKQCADDIEEIESDFRSKESAEERRLEKVSNAKVQITGMKAQIAAIEERDFKPEIEKLNQELKDLTRSKIAAEQELASLNQEKENIGFETKSVESELKRLRDVDSQKLEVVRRKDRDTYTAILWLRRNSNQFKDTIYEPPMMTVNVIQSRNAKFIENNVRKADMKTFLCTNADDHEKLFKELCKNQRLNINTGIAGQKPLSHFQPNKPIDVYRKYGFYAYLKDMIDGPEPVLAHLCKLSNLHQIPVGSSKVDQGIDIIPQECDELRRYLSETRSYAFKRSRYSGHAVTTVNKLDPASTLIHSVDEKRLDELTSRHKELQSQGKDVSDKITALNESLKQIEKRVLEVKNEKKRLINKQNERKTLQERLANKERNLQSLESEAMDIAAEKEQTNSLIQKVYDKKVRYSKEMNEKTKKMLEISKSRVLIGLQSFHLSRTVTRLEEELNQKSQAVQDLEQEYERKELEITRTKELAKRLRQEARAAVGGDLSEEYRNAFSTLPSNLEEIDALIAETQARIDLIFVDTDRAIIEEFNDRKKLIKSLENKEARKAEEVTKHMEEIAEIKRDWLPPLQAIITKINTKFSEFFREIKCAGEVNLKVPDNPEDYDNYGVAISVKYGDNKPMKELTTFQSGGERSVATVLYMLSLQQLSKSPFRCVDEINQGMDAENERRVFELVVKTACCVNTPQYFLLTPKLLPDLLYTERMCIHIVHNGPYMMDSKDWQLNNFIKRRGEFDDDDD